MERTDQQAPQPTPHAASRALTAMADELTNTKPNEPLTNPGRITLALRATATSGPGVFDTVLTQTAPIQLPMTRADYAAELRETAAQT